MKWKGIRHRAEYIAFRLVVCLLQILTPNQSARLARGLAVVLTDWLPRRLTRYDVARENLQAAFPGQLSEADVRRMIRAMWTHLFRMVAEIVQLPRRLQLNRVHEVIRFRNHGLVVRALCSGRPVILLSGHFGNWEMAVAVFGLFGFPMGVVARELDNPHLNRWFRRFRQSTGHVMLAKKGGYDDMLALIGRKGHLAMTRTLAAVACLLISSVGLPRHSNRSRCWHWNTEPSFASVTRTDCRMIRSIRASLGSNSVAKR